MRTKDDHDNHSAGSRQPSVLVVTGYGINCEEETAYAFRLAGAETTIAHVNDLLDGRESLERHQILALPGGFSYGDALGSGLALANKIRFAPGPGGTLLERIRRFVAAGKQVIGICNGFQVLVKTGLLPGLDPALTPAVSLAGNDSGRFEDRWVHLAVDSRRAVAVRGIKALFLPVRHGEGKFVTGSTDLLTQLGERGQVVLRYADPPEFSPTMAYPANPNGSEGAVAGICDPTGRVLGLMPHPEAFLTFYNHPCWARLRAEGKVPQSEEGEGLALFYNMVRFAGGDQ